MAKQPANGRKTPSKAKKTPQTGKKPVESTATADAAVIDAIPPEVHQKDPAPVAAAKQPQPEAKPVTETPKAPKQEPAAAKPEPLKQTPPAQPTPAPAKKGGFFPLVLGGLVAGAIGFVLAYTSNVQTNDGLADQMSAQRSSIQALEQQVAAIPSVDLGAIEAAQTDLAASVDALQSQMDTALGSLDDRITALENLPRGDGTAPVPAIAAYEAELEELRAEMENMTGSAMAQLDEARAEASAIEENAASAARAAAGRAALARIQTAMESGAPLGAALTDLEAAIDGPVPDALLAAEGGVPTLGSLQERFPEVARAALTTARSEGAAGEETSGLGAFLRNQLEVRSVAPRDGQDADAILSRAEASLRSGRLSDSLAEIAALPEVARAEMSDWLARAETRAAAVDAVDRLITSLNDS